MTGTVLGTRDTMESKIDTSLCSEGSQARKEDNIRGKASFFRSETLP